jgi:hypothetical protein
MRLDKRYDRHDFYSNGPDWGDNGAQCGDS